MLAGSPSQQQRAEKKPDAEQRRGPGLGNRGAAGFAAIRVYGDGVRIHGHSAIPGQRSTAPKSGTGVHSDAGKRENISGERRVCTESRGAADLPIKVIAFTAVGENNGRIACRCERAPSLKNEQRIRIALSVKGESPGQLR